MASTFDIKKFAEQELDKSLSLGPEDSGGFNNTSEFETRQDSGTAAIRGAAQDSNSSTSKGVIYESLGGSSTHVLINFHLINSDGDTVDIPVYFGTVITVSYSVYRNKASVFNMGNNLIDGFAIGNKYVAGSIIKGVFNNDDFNGLLNNIKNGLLSVPVDKIASASNKKVVHSLMKDDLLSCDINIIYTNEYTGAVKSEVIYDATFINNGQVASINDIITETTLSYVARAVKTMESSDTPLGGMSNTSTIKTATDLLLGR